MLKPLLWLSPSASDLLGAASKLLRGKVPCPAAHLAKLLREADSSQCHGWLGESSLRADLAACLEKGAAEISDANAASLVDALCSVLEQRTDAIRKAAAPFAKKLSAKGPLPSYQDVVAMLPKGVEPSELLRRDWALWHSLGHMQDAAAVPAPPNREVVCERLALILGAPAGPACECALALHVLDNLEKYIAWEMSLPGSKPPSVGKQVVNPFDEKAALEVASRRVLASALSPESALAVVTEACGSTAGLQQALQRLAERERGLAHLPLYCEPVPATAPKDPKGKKAKTEDCGGEKKDGAAPAAMAPVGKAPKPAVPAAAGSFLAQHDDLADQELRWKLLAYRLRPGTMLSASSGAGAAKPVPNAKGVATAAPRSANPNPVVNAGPVAKGFGGIWAPTGNEMPPGHTSYSWRNEAATGMKESEGFARTWAPSEGQVPPGHSAYSWERAFPSGGASSVAAPKEVKADAAAAKDKKAAGVAPKASQSAAGGAQDEGSVETAFCKLDFRCGRILECERVPDADTLYRLSVDVGEGKPRQVISGLVKHYRMEDLKNRQVVVYCNIKPTKMRGFESQAMVLAATVDKGSDHEKCELLAPPAGTKEGTRAMCGALEAGSLSEQASVKHGSKVWAQVQPLLKTDGLKQGAFDGRPLTMNAGLITVSSLGDAGIS